MWLLRQFCNLNDLESFLKTPLCRLSSLCRSPLSTQITSSIQPMAPSTGWVHQSPILFYWMTSDTNQAPTPKKSCLGMICWICWMAAPYMFQRQKPMPQKTPSGRADNPFLQQAPIPWRSSTGVSAMLWMSKKLAKWMLDGSISTSSIALKTLTPRFLLVEFVLPNWSLKNKNNCTWVQLHTILSRCQHFS